MLIKAINVKKDYQMHDNVKRLIETGWVKEIHPQSDKDVEDMNTLLKEQEDYLEGLFFNGYDIKEGVVQFYYDHPDSFTEKEEILAKQLAIRVRKEFMDSKK
jgi:hypothetical protein